MTVTVAYEINKRVRNHLTTNNLTPGNAYQRRRLKNGIKNGLEVNMMLNILFYEVNMGNIRITV